eukprot:967863-Pelagomonas_calceolata.AAC.1
MFVLIANLIVLYVPVFPASGQWGCAQPRLDLAMAAAGQPASQPAHLCTPGTLCGKSTVEGGQVGDRPGQALDARMLLL